MPAGNDRSEATCLVVIAAKDARLVIANIVVETDDSGPIGGVIVVEARYDDVAAGADIGAGVIAKLVVADNQVPAAIDSVCAACPVDNLEVDARKAHGLVAARVRRVSGGQNAHAGGFGFQRGNPGRGLGKRDAVPLRDNRRHKGKRDNEGCGP